MSQVTATALKIKYYSGAFGIATDFGVCEIYISAKGDIYTKFERDIKYSDDFGGDRGKALPISITYKYRLEENRASKIFEDFDLLLLKPAENDMPACDGGNWEMTIYTEDLNIKTKGYMPPEPFGEKLSKKIKKHIKYEMEPMIF
ncbi:MAG: hypothetical protein ACERLG_01390 [Sedimentibacter sp.]